MNRPFDPENATEAEFAGEARRLLNRAAAMQGVRDEVYSGRLHAIRRLRASWWKHFRRESLPAETRSLIRPITILTKQSRRGTLKVYRDEIPINGPRS